MPDWDDHLRDLEDRIAADLWRNGPSTEEEVARRVGWREFRRAMRFREPLRQMLAWEHGDPSRWSIPESALPHTAAGRPRGPFGPAYRLLPFSQVLYRVDVDRPIGPTLERMLENQYSAVPVIRDDEVIGVVTAASIHELFLKQSRTGITLDAALQSPVGDALQPVQFVDPLAYIDEGIDWLVVEHVVVGSPTRPLGLLTISDVWRYLDGFAHAFVLLHQIETGLRQLIAMVLDAGGLDVVEVLTGIPIVEGRPRPTALDQLTFREHYLLMRLASVRSLFDRHLDALDDAEARFREVNDMRNAIAHFRVRTRPVVPGDERDEVEPLRRFRRWVEGCIKVMES